MKRAARIAESQPPTAAALAIFSPLSRRETEFSMTVSSGIRFIVQHHLACMKNLHLRCACQSISQSRQKSNDDWKDVICTRFMLKIDLNLFRIFNALMEHRSVTRAAHHLGVTQPAVSHALTRLRKALDDPLFIRAQSGSSQPPERRKLPMACVGVCFIFGTLLLQRLSIQRLRNGTSLSRRELFLYAVDSRLG
jgi:DNA-binding transcriptional ArsR family regulator